MRPTRDATAPAPTEPRSAQALVGWGGLALAASAFLPLVRETYCCTGSIGFAPYHVIEAPPHVWVLLAPFVGGLLVALAAGGRALRAPAVHACGYALLCALFAGAIPGGLVFLAREIPEGMPPLVTVISCSIWLALTIAALTALKRDASRAWRLARLTWVGGASCAAGFLSVALLTSAYHDIAPQLGLALGLAGSLALVAGGGAAEASAARPRVAVPHAIAR